VTENTFELLAGRGQLVVERLLELAPLNLQLLDGQHAEADRHVERIAQESERFVAHATTLVAPVDVRQRATRTPSGVDGAAIPGE